VSLHTIIPRFSAFKIKYTLPFLQAATDYLDPQWGLRAPTLTAKLVDLIVQLTHHECDNPVCKEVSFTYGSGRPALWRHENLSDATHEWLKREFAKVPLTFFEQMKRCVERGHLLSVEGKKELPADFTAQPPQTDARFAFFAGDVFMGSNAAHDVFPLMLAELDKPH
jgi:hypothetical protein